MKTSRRALLVGSAAALSLPLTSRLALAAPQPVLIELFTSQGCSSCPPADQLAGELAKRDDVIVASLNVDYWDYIGWKDTLAKPEYSQRQRDYALSRGDGNVYTPQMVANGALHAVGSSRRGVDAMIAQAQEQPMTAALAIRRTNKEIAISVDGPQGADGTVWFMSIAPSVTVEISRGENSGETITYHNVVRHLTPAGMWKGGAATFSLPRSAVTGDDCKLCIAVLQEGVVGRVIGLARDTI